MIKHYEGIVRKAPYLDRKDAVFIDHFLKPIIDTIKDEVDSYGPISRMQVLTNPTLESPFFLFKEEDFENPSYNGYLPLLEPLSDFVGQNCKIMLEFY